MLPAEGPGRRTGRWAAVAGVAAMASGGRGHHLVLGRLGVADHMTGQASATLAVGVTGGRG